VKLEDRVNIPQFHTSCNLPRQPLEKTGIEIPSSSSAAAAAAALFFEYSGKNFNITNQTRF
jgi:hypothetical protein